MNFDKNCVQMETMLKNNLLEGQVTAKSREIQQSISKTFRRILTIMYLDIYMLGHGIASDHF